MRTYLNQNIHFKHIRKLSTIAAVGRGEDKGYKDRIKIIKDIKQEGLSLQGQMMACQEQRNVINPILPGTKILIQNI